jgi:uncharacterized protein YwgA
MTRKDWTLLVIAAARGDAVSPVQLQKSLFLIDRNLSPTSRGTTHFYHFRAYDYGPFDGAIYSDATELALEGFVLVHPESGASRRYIATPTGLSRAETLRKELEGGVVVYLDEVVTWVRRLSFNELVGAIYHHYPEMKANSVFQA